jgi:sodium transport system permease protein
MLRDIRTVYLKELREVLRDRRTLVFMLVLPIVLMPLIAGVTMAVFRDAHDEAAHKELRYAIFARELAPEVPQALSRQEGFREVELAGPSEIPAVIREGEIDFAITMAERLDGRITVEVHEDDAKLFKSTDRVGPVIEGASKERTAALLADAGVQEPVAQQRIVEPLEVVERGIASKREVIGTHIGGFLPYMLILFGFLGALYPATDLAAGEKERGTLETLLLAPISRTAIVVGKFGVVCTTAVTSAVLGVSGIGVWLAVDGQQASGALGEVLRAVSFGDLTLVALLSVPVAALMAALLLSVSIFAKSFKEAQAYAGPLNMLVIMPAFVGMLPGVELDARWACVPVCNVALAVKEIVKGTLDPGLAVLVFVSSLAVAGSMLVFCVHWFRRESVLFRQ